MRGWRALDHKPEAPAVRLAAPRQHSNGTGGPTEEKPQRPPDMTSSESDADDGSVGVETPVRVERREDGESPHQDFTS